MARSRNVRASVRSDARAAFCCCWRLQRSHRGRFPCTRRTRFDLRPRRGAFADIVDRRSLAARSIRSRPRRARRRRILRGRARAIARRSARALGRARRPPRASSRLKRMSHVRAKHLTTIVLLAASLSLAGTALAQEANPARRVPQGFSDDPVRVLIKLRGESAKGDSRTQASLDKVAALAARAGVTLTGRRALGASLQVVELDPRDTPEAQLQRLRADSAVEYVEIDERRFVNALPNDPLYSQQWYQQVSAATPAAIDAEHAWDVTPGTAGVVIAVLDTGVRF